MIRCDELNLRHLSYFICVNICIFLSAFLFSTHRFYSVNDVSKAITIYNLAESAEDSRCKKVNASQSICLPSILFIGASKCGTTSLTDQLSLHSKIHFVGRRITPTDHHKEVHRFDRNTYEYAIKSIEFLDELASSPTVDDVNQPIIHYTPHYFFSPSVPFEVKSFYKHSSRLKFILMLRNPVDRALSSYWFKNSHLFQDIDKGNIDAFWNNSLQEIVERSRIEACLCNELSKSIDPSIHVMGEYIDPLFSRPEFTSMHALFNKKLGVHLPNKCYFSRIFEMLHRIEANYYSFEYGVNDKKILRGRKRREGQEEVDFLRTKYFTSLEKCYSNRFRGAASGHSLIEKGIYADQLIRWMVNFPSKSQFYLINFKNWVTTQETEYKKLILYLGLNISHIEVHKDQLFGNRIIDNSYLSLYDHLNDRCGIDNSVNSSNFPLGCSLIEEAATITNNTTSFRKGRLIKPNSKMQDITSDQNDELSSFFLPYNILLESITDMPHRFFS